MFQAEYREKMKRWDTYFMALCDAIASKSPCHSRNIGALVVIDKSIASTGFNGPARGYPHCETCIRKADPNYKSGQNLDKCPAAHAEGNCISNAARTGTSLRGGTLYLNTDFPCKDCMTAIVNAGIIEVVSLTGKPYHVLSFDIAKHGLVDLRKAVL